MKATNPFFFLIFVLLIVGYLIVYKQKYASQPIRADAEGYYAYLPAFFIYKDYAMKQVNLYQPDASSFSHPPIYLNPQTGNYIDKYPMGEALLLLPFFILAHLLTRIFNLPATGYSWIYQHAAGIAAIFYLIIGLFCLFRLIKKVYSPKIAFLTIFSLVFATNLYHYATYDSLMSHVFSFFLLSLLLWQSLKWQKKPTIVHAVFMGIILGLIFLTRNFNLLFTILLIPLGKKYPKKLPVVVISFVLTILPQLLYWRYATNKLFFFSYQGESFNFLQPQIFNVLFSPRKGLFFWTPVLLFIVLGFRKTKDKLSAIFPYLIIVLTIFLYLISSWHDWSFGAGFGHRAFIDIYPILGLFIGGFFYWVEKKIVLNKFVLLSLIFLTLLNLTNMFKYWQKILPYDQVSLSIYYKNLFIFIK